MRVVCELGKERLRLPESVGPARGAISEKKTAALLRGKPYRAFHNYLQSASIKAAPFIFTLPCI